MSFSFKQFAKNIISHRTMPFIALFFSVLIWHFGGEVEPFAWQTVALMAVPFFFFSIVGERDQAKFERVNWKRMPAATVVFFLALIASFEPGVREFAIAVMMFTVFVGGYSALSGLIYFTECIVTYIGRGIKSLGSEEFGAPLKDEDKPKKTGVKKQKPKKKIKKNFKYIAGILPVFPLVVFFLNNGINGFEWFVLILYISIYLWFISQKEQEEMSSFLEREKAKETLKRIIEEARADHYGDTDKMAEYILDAAVKKYNKPVASYYIDTLHAWLNDYCKSDSLLVFLSTQKLEETVDDIDRLGLGGYAYIAKLESETSHHLGSGGKSTRFRRMDEISDGIAFILGLLPPLTSEKEGMEFTRLLSVNTDEILLKSVEDLAKLPPSEIIDESTKVWAENPSLHFTVPIIIPTKTRFEHTWCIAPPGTGKTQLIQYLVSQDLPRVERGEASIVVMDSAGDLIEQISGLNLFSEGQPLEGKLIIIKPDLEYPPALNLFDMGKDRISGYNEKDRERFTNTIIDQLTYVIDAMMGESATLTSKQETLYRYVIRLLVAMPETTLDDFSKLLTVTGGAEMHSYKKYINTLSKPAQDFFREQFLGKEFKATKEQIAWRLSRLRENTLFDRMFASPKSKLDLFNELNESKVILIHTDIENLKAEGTNVMGRYFIGALLAASQERASLSRSKRLPVFTYIDECQDYIANDTKIATLLDQARKMNVGMFLAHQRCAQINNRNVLDALGNTAIKFASTDNPNDLPLVSKAMRCEPDFIATQPEMSFAVSARRATAPFSFKVPFLTMEKMPKMDKEEGKVVNSRIRRKYYSKYTEEPLLKAAEDVTEYNEPEDDPDNPAI